MLLEAPTLDSLGQHGSAARLLVPRLEEQWLQREQSLRDGIQKVTARLDHKLAIYSRTFSPGKAGDWAAEQARLIC